MLLSAASRARSDGITNHVVHSAQLLCLGLRQVMAEVMAVVSTASPQQRQNRRKLWSIQPLFCIECHWIILNSSHANALQNLQLQQVRIVDASIRCKYDAYKITHHLSVVASSIFHGRTQDSIRSPKSSNAAFCLAAGEWERRSSPLLFRSLFLALKGRCWQLLIWAGRIWHFL